MYWGFPTNKEAYEAKVKEAMTEATSVDENGNETVVPKYSYWIDEDTTVEVYAATQADIDAVNALIAAPPAPPVTTPRSCRSSRTRAPPILTEKRPPPPWPTSFRAESRFM
jgi:hypothetical protein